MPIPNIPIEIAVDIEPRGLVVRFIAEGKKVMFCGHELPLVIKEIVC